MQWCVIHAPPIIGSADEAEVVRANPKFLSGSGEATGDDCREMAALLADASCGGLR